MVADSRFAVEQMILWATSLNHSTQPATAVERSQPLKLSLTLENACSADEVSPD